MSAVDEARALLAVPSTRRFMTTVDHTEFAMLDAAPRLLAALCAEVEDLRAADAAHERRHALSERGDGYADRVIAELRAERDALRADAELARRYRAANARYDVARTAYVESFGGSDELCAFNAAGREADAAYEALLRGAK